MSNWNSRLVNPDGQILKPDTYFNKTRMNKLRLEHNRIVKKNYHVETWNQNGFDEWFINNCNGFNHIEIPRTQTKDGNPYILEAE